MSKFEEIGINYQFDAKNIHEADKALATSCDICVKSGKNISCDKCRIEYTHQLIVSYFTTKQKGMAQ